MNIARAGRFDPHDMLGAVQGLPDQIVHTWRAHAGLTLPWSSTAFDAVAFLGMGGSAIGGDLAARLLADRLRVPVIVVRDATLPAWVGPRTLVIGASFSGNTAETLATWAAAGARGVPRVALTSGGELAARAAAEGVPIVRLPAGGAPRAALGHSLASVMAIWRAVGFVGDVTAELERGASAMRALIAHDAATALDDGRDNPNEWDSASTSGVPTDSVTSISPSRLAAALHRRFPVIVVDDALAAVGLRWKTQLNENAKIGAAVEVLPELHHNSVVGYGGPRDINRRLTTVLLATQPADPAIEATVALLDEQAIEHRQIIAPPGDLFVQGLWLVQLGDLTSVRLAYRRGVDPHAIAAIDRLKVLLGARRGNAAAAG